MKIISYSFFEPKIIHKHREWDKFNNIDRYWYVLPALIAINTLIYPDFTIKFHISKNIKNNNLYKLLEVCEKEYGVEVEVIDRDYINTEPTIWRYKPLLNKECNLLLCRDIDSLPTSDEIRSTYFFNDNEKYKVGTIRSHKNHKIRQTIILAGLCSFRPEDIDLGLNFDQFLNKHSTPNWGLDQDFLINSFTSDKDFVKNNFLDSRLNSKNHHIQPPLVNSDSFDEKFYRGKIDLNISNGILTLLDEITDWSGEPIDVRGGKLKKLLTSNDSLKKMLDILESDKTLKKFYL